MTNLKNILVAGAVALGVTAIAQVDASADTVTVKVGDTVSEIAYSHQTTVEAIDELNPTVDKNTHLIYVGDELIINKNNEVIRTEPQEPVFASAPVQNTPQAPQVAVSVEEQAPKSPAVPVQSVVPANKVATQESGSSHDQFISAGGTESMWSAIVLPESGGNVNASNGQYHGLGQTNQSWGYGSVASQTQGMMNYATSRYGSVDNAISFRESNGWW